MTATTLRDRQIAWLIAYREHGDERARELLIRSLEGLAVSCAGRFMGSGIDVDDMKSAAMVGLLESIEKHDFSRGDAIAATAWQWCRRRVMELIDSSADAAVSGGAIDRRIRRRLMPLMAGYEAQGHSSTVALALACEELEVPLVRAERWLGARSAASVSADDAPEIECDAAPVDDGIGKAQAAALMRRAMSVLDDRERDIVEQKLLGRTPSFDALAEKYGVSTRRIRQVFDIARGKVLEELSELGIDEFGDLF